MGPHTRLRHPLNNTPRTLATLRIRYFSEGYTNKYPLLFFHHTMTFNTKRVPNDFLLFIELVKTAWRTSVATD